MAYASGSVLVSGRFAEGLSMGNPQDQEFDRIAKAFDLAQDGSKQLLTLSAGIVVVTITFFSDFGGHATPAAKILMAISWFCYLLSVTAGIFVLNTLAGNLQHGRMDIYLDPTRLFSRVQILVFLLALLLTIVAGAVTWL